MAPILTVGITSYKRINELVRCIDSIQTKYVNDIEILVSEDKSPLSFEIEQTVKEIAKQSKYKINFTSNDINLGYDMNLGAIISKASGKYIMYMSDDDAIYGDFLDELIPFLLVERDVGVIYAPFVYADTDSEFKGGKDHKNPQARKDRMRSDKNFRISPCEKNAAKYIYDAILFSGLIFKKDYVKDFDSSRFKNYNYFQVYLFLQMLLKYGGFYFAKPAVLCIGDGENAYGISESSGGNALLANRKSVKSDLEFNKTLIKLIKTFDEEEKTHIFKSFAIKYSVHSISGLSIARSEGIEYFKEYWATLNSLDIHLYPIAKCYYFMLLFLGAKLTNKFLYIFRKIAKREH